MRHPSQGPGIPPRRCEWGGEYKVRSFPEDRKRIDIGDYYADDRLIRKVLGWEPKVPLREGLASTLAYYRADLKHYL
jgi:UDP-glucose 4-epimerase